MRRFALSPLVFDLLLKFFVPLLQSAMSNELCLVFRLQILSILSLLAEDVIGDLFGRAPHIGELLDHATNLTTVLLEDGV
jgi:hypothetical protein